MGTTLSLNFRKPKKYLTSTDEVSVCVRYYFKNENGKPQYLNLSTGIKVQLKHWDEDWDKKKKLSPVKRGDKDYIQKNIEIGQLKENIDTIERDIVREGDIPYPSLVKSKYRGKKIQKRKETYKDVHFLYMYKLYEEWCVENLTPAYKTTMITQIKFVKQFCEDYQERNNFILLVTDIDEDFIRKYVIWCYNNQNLQPSMLNKRMRGFSNFRNWSNRLHKTNYNITLPTGLVKEGKFDVINLTRDEVKKLYEWKDFDYLNDNHIKYLRGKTFEMEYITDERVGVKEESKRFSTYTNFEVMKDILLFLCNTGMRYGDMLNIKVDNFRYYKLENGKEDRTRGMWEFRMEKVPGKGIVRVPSNRISFEIYKKYSSGKQRENYLFPRTKFGNPISNQKFNKHIKKVCEVIGINELVEKPRFTIDGKVIDGTDTRLPKYETISSHIGRRSFIREQIELGKNQREIMYQTGHTSIKVFNGYYDIKPSDLWKSGNEMYFGFDLDDKKDENKKVKQTPKDIINDDIENRLETLKNWFLQDKIDEVEYKELKRKALNLN